MNYWERTKNWWFNFCLNFKKGFSAGKGLVIMNRPIIDIRDGARIEIGRHVTLNSRNYGSHVNMHSSVKLFANINNSAVIKIGDFTRVNGSCIHAREKIEIGKNCLIAPNCQIFDSSAHDLLLENPQIRINSKGGSRSIKIHDHVWIGANSIILPGVTIGEGSVIGAGSVVTRDIPPFSMAAGNPASVLKTRE